MSRTTDSLKQLYQHTRRGITWLLRWKKTLTVLAVLLIIFLLGFPSYPNDECKLAAYRRHAMAEKELASAAIKGQNIGSIPAEDFVKQKVFGMVMGEVAPHEVKLDDDGGMSVQFNGFMTLGSATAISRDGYVLTAAHCADTEPIHVLFRNGLKRSEMGMLKARVVWTGSDELDLALLHVPVQLKECFDLTDAQELHAHEQAQPTSPGDSIFSMGFTEGKSTLTKGTFVRVDKTPSHSEHGDWSIFIHNAPLFQGDSGGAVFDSQGRLLAINYGAEARVFRWMGHDFLWKYRGKAIIPNAEKIKALIEKDRARRSHDNTKNKQPAASQH